MVKSTMTKTPLTGIQVRQALVKQGMNPNKVDEKGLYAYLAAGTWEGTLTDEFIAVTAENFFLLAPKPATSHIAN